LNEEMAKDIVLTVSPFWGKEKRERLEKVAELAGFRVLNVLGDLTAAAVDFASTRTFEGKPSYVVFFGMGSIGASAVLMKFSQLGNESRVIDVLKMKYDEKIGGLSFDSMLADYFAEEYDKIRAAKSKDLPSIKNNLKATIKLRYLANQVKESLSVVESEDISLEALDGETDFKLTLTRQKLEEINDDLFRKSIIPITKLLEETSFTPENIELFGGGWRVPKVQTYLQQIGIPLGIHVNGEEGVAFGAAFYGAVQKRTVPVHIIVNDLVPSENSGSLPPLSPAALKRSVERIGKVEAKEKAREKAIQAKNLFETYLYEAKDKIEEKERKKEIGNTQREEMEGVLANEEEWLSENGNVNHVGEEIYLQRLLALKKALVSIGKLKDEL